MSLKDISIISNRRPGYAAEPLAKLYVYSYQNRLRSSRKIEKEARRNIEVIWLTDGLTPDYKTISEFRRMNIRPPQKLFREFVKLCRSWELVDGELVAADGSKFKASNNKKNNFSKKKLKDRLARIDEKIAEYLSKLDEETACYKCPRMDVCSSGKSGYRTIVL